MNVSLKTVLTAVAAAAVIATSALAANINGAGASFPYPIYAKWAGAYQGVSGVGLNWYLNNEVKVQFHDSFVHVNKHAGIGTSAAAIVPIGQNLNIVGIRLQFTN